MKTLKPLTVATAPEQSQATLEKIQKGYGFIPNLMATFANSPAVLNSYLAMDNTWNEQSTLSPKERQLILLTASVQNHCDYCKAAHSTILKSMMKVDAELVTAVREQKALADGKLNALVTFTRELVAERGYVSENTKENFLKHGYREEQMAEVLIGVALKTISNYLDHLNPVEIDAGFKPEA